MTILQELYYQRETILDRLHDRRVKKGGGLHTRLINECWRLTVAIERLENKVA